MGPLGWIVAATVGVSLIAWIGALTLFLREELLDAMLLALVALAAGSLVGGAFFHLIPRAIAEAGVDDTLPPFLWLLGGFRLFYVLEQFLHWHHHSATHEHEPVSCLVLISDSLHDFVDGLVIAGAFLLNVQLGLATTLAIALHEVRRNSGTSASSSTAGSSGAARSSSTTPRGRPSSSAG
nr:ZIP family metal transporter [Halobaculum salinum]